MSSSLALGAPMPPSMGLCADLYHEVRELRLAMAKEVAEVAKREKEIKDFIIANLSKSLDTGAAGLKYRAQITTKAVPSISDWGVFCSWIRKNDRFDCIEKRASATAINDLWAEREEVPGIERFNVLDVSITKI